MDAQNTIAPDFWIKFWKILKNSEKFRKNEFPVFALYYHQADAKQWLWYLVRKVTSWAFQICHQNWNPPTQSQYSRIWRKYQVKDSLLQPSGHGILIMIPHSKAYVMSFPNIQSEFKSTHAISVFANLKEKLDLDSVTHIVWFRYRNYCNRHTIWIL